MDSMKRSLTVALMLMIGFGCGGGKSSDDTSTDTSVDVPEEGDADVIEDPVPDGIDVTEDPGTDVVEDPEDEDITEDPVTDGSEDIVGDTGWPPTYEVETPTYIGTITIPAVDEGVPECCYDFGAISKDHIEYGTDELDNAFALLADTLAGIPSLGLSMQDEIDASLDRGDLVILLDHRGLDGDTDVFMLVELAGLFDAGTTYTTAAAGTGEFLIARESFTDGASVPEYYFDPAQMESLAMSAGPGQFKIMGTFGFLNFPLVLQDSRIAGTATIESDGVTYVDGTISGYALISDVFDEFNEMLLSSGCSCLGITDPVFTQETSGEWSASCVADAETLCTTADNSVCATIAGDDIASSQICSVLPALLAGSADIDLDSDPTMYEAMSYGLQWTGTTATINGLEP